MAGEVAIGYVQIVAETSKLSQGIRAAVGDKSLNTSATSAGQRISAAMGKALRTGALAAGAAAGGIMATALTKGFNRLNAIDQAEAKLRGLGRTAEEIGTIMDGAGAAVRGTAFGLDEAATAASKLASSGLDVGEELDRAVRLTADIATQAGEGMDEISSIMAKVAGAGKLTGETLAQLDDRAVGAASAIADHFNVSIEEARQMVSNGAVDFETFSTIMEEHIGGAALESGNTFQGAMDNMGAALGRVGVTLVEGPFQAAPGVIGAVTDAIDRVNEKLKAAMELLMTGDFTPEIGDALGVEEDSRAVGAILAVRDAGIALHDTFTNLDQSPAWHAVRQGIADFFDRLWRLGEAVAPLFPVFLDLAVALGETAGAISMEVWSALIGLMEVLAPIISGVVTPAIETLGSILAENQWAVELAAKAWIGFKAAQKINQGVTGAISAVTGAVGKLKSGFDKAKDGAQLAWSVIGEAGSSRTAIVDMTKAWTNNTTATKIATGVQKAFNAVLNMNPMMKIIAVIALVVAALTWFFTKTELGQKVWQALMDKLRAAGAWLQEKLAPVWQAIAEKFQQAWEKIQEFWANTLEPIFNKIAEVVQIVIAVIFTVFVAPLLLYWQMISAAFTWAWETVIQPVIGWIGEKLAELGQWFVAVWNDWIKPAWDALGLGIQWVWETVIRPAWDALVAALGAVGAFFQWWWNNVTKPAWDAFGNGVRWVWETVIRPAWDALKAALQAVGDFFQMVWNSVIKPAWDALGSGIRTVIDTVVMPAWDKMKEGLDRVGQFFDSVTEGIGRVWDSLRGKLAKPINFMIRTVYNAGIRKAWNTVADVLPGVDPLGELSGIPEHATGGPIRGPGTGTSDDVLMWGSSGEHMLTAAEVRAAGGHGAIHMMRALLARGIPFEWNGAATFAGIHPATFPAVTRELTRDGTTSLEGFPALPGYRDGGEIRPAWEHSIERAHRYAQANSPRRYLLGASTATHNATDCSGWISEIADVALGGPGGHRQWATGNFPGTQQGAWARGLSKGFSVGIVHGGPAGGHTAGTLSAAGPFRAVNVESGGNTGQGSTYGGPSAGADSPSLPEKWHLKIGADGDFEAAGGPSPEEMRSALRKFIEKTFDLILNPIKAALPKPPPEWEAIPHGYLDKGKEVSTDWLMSKVNGLGGLLRSVWDLLEDAGGDAVGLLRDQGGWIPPGLSIVRNETGKPEAVLTAEQIRGVQDAVAVASGIPADSGDSTDGAQPGTSGGDEPTGPIRWDLIAAQTAGAALLETWNEILGFADLGTSGIQAPKLVDEHGRQVTTGGTGRDVHDSAASADTGQPADVALVPDGQPVAVPTTDGDVATVEPVTVEVTEPTTPATPQAAVQAVFAKHGWGDGDHWAGTDNIVTRESNWNPKARNPSSGAFGLFQFNPSSGTLQQYLPDYNEDPAVQGEAGRRYISDRYGDPTKAWAFWQANGWYDKGGIARGVGVMAKGTIAPERVLSPQQTQMFDDLISMLPNLLSKDTFRTVGQAGGAAVGAGAATIGASAIAAGASALVPMVGPMVGAVAPSLVSAIGNAGSTLGGVLGEQAHDMFSDFIGGWADDGGGEGGGGGGDTININIDGAHDPQAVAREVEKILYKRPRRAGAGARI